LTYHPPAFEGRIDVNLTLPPKIAMKGPKTPDPKENLLSVDVEPKLNDTLLVTNQGGWRRPRRAWPHRW